MPTQQINLPGLTISPFKVDKGSSMFDLSLFIWEKDEGLIGELEYNTDLFDEATIERMMKQWAVLLEGIVANPDQPINRIALLPKNQEHQLLIDWNETKMDYPHDQCLHHLFEAQAALNPEKVAFIYDNESLTYKQLNERSNQLAHYLHSLGVGPDILVGIYVDRSIEMVVGLLGILKSSGGYVPLDPAFPKDRLAFMLADSQAPVLLTQESLKDGLAVEDDVKVVCLDSDWASIAQQSADNLPNIAQPDNLAYVIYTSGSTGKPKGVQLQHQGVVNFLTTMRQEPGLTPEDVLLSVTTLSFDISVLEIFLPLITGAQIVLVSRETAADGLALQAKLAESGANVMQATPTTWRLLIDSGWPGNDNLKVMCGGEALPRELANQILERCDTLWNMYGPTETTIWSTVYQLQPGETGGVSIGRPIGNTQCYILDSYLQPVPIGVPGELHIGGDGLARGYLNRPELTAEKFIHDPFSDQPKARMYKTGDLVRFLPDGNIEFLSRIDHQIKIRGFRVELGEIETILTQHPAIRTAVVIVREDQPGDKRLVAYLITDDGKDEVPASELRTFVREELPDYMVPSAYVFMDAYPLTPNKKIDRKALPVPDQTGSELDETFVAPRDELELELKKIWESVLNIQRVGVRDNFFDLGGHSLLAVRLFIQIDEVLGKSLPLVALFQAPTIEELANLLRQEGWTPSSPPVVALQEGNSDRQPFFCVPPAGTSILDYVNLVRHLEPNQPVYGLQPMSLNAGQEFMFDRVDAIAAQLIKEVQNIQPEGPYLLGGRCFGGIVAYEMARQLTDQGQQVNFLALFDTPFPNPTLASKVKFHAQNLARLEYKDKLKYVLRKARKRTVRITSRFRANGKHELSPEVRALQAQAGISVATNNYTPPTYHGKVTLFRAEEDIPPGSASVDFGWGKVAAGGIDAQIMPGNHRTIMIEPSVRVLAEKVRMYLEQF
ncbi:MAG: amino acid adenylation domain-containing protein [Anaerolineae bacterium]|nr:amino acid adenylation domain-containing protein [Anaerolineae bacterium]